MSSRHVRGALVYNTFKKVLTGNYVVGNESVIIVEKTVGAATQITAPPSGVGSGGLREVIVLDGLGDAATHNITIVPTGADTINGGASYVITTNYGRARLVDDQVGNWSVAIETNSATTMTAGASGTAGEVDVFPATAAKGKTSFTATNNAGNTTTNINTAAQAGARTLTVPDPAIAASSFIMAGAPEVVPILAPRVRCTTQFDAVTGTTGVTLTNVVGLSVTLVAGRKYAFRAKLFTVSTANGGLKLGLGGTATATSLIAEVKTFTTTTPNLSAQITALGSLGGATVVTDSAEISGEIVCNAGGTFTIQAAQNAAHADTTSVKVGSFLVVEDVA